MEKTDLYELIESYLENTLTDAKQQEVEQRMAIDDAFRKEVELHRALQEDYADPDRWHLRSALSEIMEQPLPSDESVTSTLHRNTGSRRKWWTETLTGYLIPTGSWKWAMAIIVAILVIVGFWFFNRPTATQLPKETPMVENPVPPVKENKPPVEQQDEAPKTSEHPETPIVKKEKQSPPKSPSTPPPPKETRPIAQADPADFAENPNMEAYMQMRSSALVEITVTEPLTPPNQATTTFDPNNNGKTELHFSGMVEKAAPNMSVTLDLKIYDNKESKRPIRILPLPINTDAEGKASFDIREEVDFKKGLYYFRIEEMESGEPLVVGRFFIGSQ